MNYVKIRNFYSSEDTTWGMKRQSMKLEKILMILTITHKELVLRKQ